MTISQPPTCNCSYQDIRVRTCIDGRKQYVKQCQVCGKSSSPLAKSTIPYPEVMPPVDDLLVEQWNDKWRKYQDQQRASYGQKNKEWWDAYDKYRLSPKWQAIRDKVLERDHHLCQGCFGHRATTAHHLTYQHVCHEFVFELVAVCVECHQRLHPPEERGSS